MLQESAARSQLTRDLEALPAVLAGEDGAGPRRTLSFISGLLTRKVTNGTPRTA
jgi:hypothetical protein